MAETTPDQKKGINLVKIGGIQIKLDYSWFIFFALVLWSPFGGILPANLSRAKTIQTYWTAGLIAALLFFVSVVTHELSHSLTAIRSGIKIPDITFLIFGGMATLSEEAGDPKTEFKIAIVRPLTSFALAIVFWLIQNAIRGEQLSIIVEIFCCLAWINVALAVFNLIPGFPLDSGRVFDRSLEEDVTSGSNSHARGSDDGHDHPNRTAKVSGDQTRSGELNTSQKGRVEWLGKAHRVTNG